VPVVALAQVNNPSGGIPTKLVTCTGADCNWKSFLALMQNVLNFMVFIGVSISALMFAYAGFLYLTSGGSNKTEDAKRIFGHVALGLIIMLVAWLVVDVLLKTLTGKGFRERNIQVPGPTLTIDRDFGTVGAYEPKSPGTIG
jgi:hypothetical protein